MCATDGLHSGFRKAEVLNLTFLNQVLHRARNVFDWHVRVNTVLIEQINRIDLGTGSTIKPLSDAERNDANKVRGCASQVWLITEPQTDGTLGFRGDSDAHIVRGLIGVLLRLYSGRPPADILAFDAKAAAARLSKLDHEGKHKILELVATVTDSDEELDLAEDAYLRKVAEGLGLPAEDLEGMTIEILEDDELEGFLER